MADRIGWLAEVDTDLEFNCRNCSHKVGLAPEIAIARYGAETRISDLRARGGRCRKCGSRDVRIGASLRAYFRSGGR